IGLRRPSMVGRRTRCFKCKMASRVRQSVGEDGRIQISEDGFPTPGRDSQSNLCLIACLSGIWNLKFGILGTSYEDGHRGLVAEWSRPGPPVARGSARGDGDLRPCVHRRDVRGAGASAGRGGSADAVRGLRYGRAGGFWVAWAVAVGFPLVLAR